VTTPPPASTTVPLGGCSSTCIDLGTADWKRKSVTDSADVLTALSVREARPSLGAALNSNATLRLFSLYTDTEGKEDGKDKGAVAMVGAAVLRPPSMSSIPLLTMLLPIGGWTDEEEEEEARMPSSRLDVPPVGKTEATAGVTEVLEKSRSPSRSRRLLELSLATELLLVCRGSEEVVLLLIWMMSKSPPPPVVGPEMSASSNMSSAAPLGVVDGADVGALMPFIAKDVSPPIMLRELIFAKFELGDYFYGVSKSNSMSLESFLDNAGKVSAL
jgi:hypothetical protein